MKIRLSCVLIACVSLLSCSQINIKNPTNDFLAAKRVVKLSDKRLREVSGAASSINNRGRFWLHNDSGNDAEVFLVDTSLNVLLTCRLNVDNRDWEDMAVGPGPEAGKSYIYVGDIGDNNAKNQLKYIYRFEEPKWQEGQSSLEITDYDTIVFQLPDEKKDCETLLIDPTSKDLYVISKREDPVWMYKVPYPQSTRDTIIAARLFSLPFTQIVAGDVSPDGSRVVLKNYEHIYYWRSDSPAALEKLLRKKPFEIPYEIEPQGEAIAWARDFSGFYTLSEQNIGKDTFLYFYETNTQKK